MAVPQVSGVVRFGVTAVHGLALLADAVIGFSGVNHGPSWFVGIVMGGAIGAVALFCFAVKVPMVGWYATGLAAVMPPTTLVHLPNLLLVGWAVAMAVLDHLRQGALAALPPPPPAGSWF